MPEPEARRDRDRRQQMRGIEHADIELVAHVGPRHFPHQRDVESFGGRKALVDGHDQGGGVDKWNELFIFASECFAVPGQCGGYQHKGRLATKVNAAIAGFPSALPSVQPKPKSKSRPSTDSLAARVSAKLEDGDVRGAIRLVASEDAMAPFDDITAASLQAKHPPRAVSDTRLRRHQPTYRAYVFRSLTSCQPSDRSYLVQPVGPTDFDHNTSRT